MRALLLEVLLLGLVACGYDASFDGCTIRCSIDTGCPEGLACGPEGLCRLLGDNASCTRPPSCEGLSPTCGPTASDNCCSSAERIPGGTFLRGYDVAADGMYADASHPATISSFTLDKYEVTVGRFRRFVTSGGGTRIDPPPPGASERTLNGAPDQGGWDPTWSPILVADTAALVAAVKCDAIRQSWTDAVGASESAPVNCVTWYEAFAFCAWDGGFLPTDAEWNFSASGGDEQRAYPWSSPPGATDVDCSYANYNPNHPSGPACVDAPNRVGSESPGGDGRWGHADLGGNVGEWVLDWYAAYSATACEDCAYLTATGDRVVRASDFVNGAGTLRTAFRKYTTPTGNRDPKIGIRCARP